MNHQNTLTALCKCMWVQDRDRSKEEERDGERQKETCKWRERQSQIKPERQ